MGMRQGQWATLNDEAEPLWKRYRTDATLETRNALVAHYMPFARYLAVGVALKLPTDAKTDVEDLFNNACMALIDLVQRFDVERGSEFTAFASLRLHGACIDHIRQMDWVPRLERRAERNGDVVPVKLGSIDISGDDEHDDQTKDQSVSASITNTSTSESEWRRENSEFFAEATKSLNQVQRQIVILYYQDDLTMKEIGRLVGLSESRVSQCHSAVVNLLRQNWTKHGVPSDAYPEMRTTRKTEPGTKIRKRKVVVE